MHDLPSSHAGPYQEFVGIYHADGSILGELRYLFGKWRGTAHCSLCDISHGGLREKPEFRRLRAELPVPLQTLHLDEITDDLRRASQDKTPCVVGRTSEGWEIVLDSQALENFEHSVSKFERALRQKLSPQSR